MKGTVLDHLDLLLLLHRLLHLILLVNLVYAMGYDFLLLFLRGRRHHLDHRLLVLQVFLVVSLVVEVEVVEVVVDHRHLLHRQVLLHEPSSFEMESNFYSNILPMDQQCILGLLLTVSSVVVVVHSLMVLPALLVM